MKQKKNKKEFKFSILMCLYNVEDYLREAVDSIISQDIGFEDNVQIILVNDGSPDNCETICQEYKEKYPDNIVYVKKKNGGLSDARNTGLKYVEGKYLNFFDADDILSEPTLREMYQFLEQHPEIDLACIPLVFFEARTGLHPKYKLMGDKNRVIDLDEEPYNYISSSASAFYKTDKIKNKKFDTTMVGGEDTKFNCELYKENKKVGYVCENNVVYNYRKRETQQSIVDTVSQNPKAYISLANRFKAFDKENLENYEKEVIIYELRSFLKNFTEEVFESKKDYNDVKKVFEEYVRAIEDEFIINESKWVDTIDQKILLLKLKGSNIIDLINKEILPYKVRINLRQIKIKNNKLIIEILFNNFNEKDITLIMQNKDGKEILPKVSKDIESKFDLKYGKIKLDITHYRKFIIDLDKSQKLSFKFKINDKVLDTKKINIYQLSNLPLGSNNVGLRNSNKIVKVTNDYITITKYTRKNLYYNITTTLKLFAETKKLLLWRLLSKKNKKYILINDRPEKACDNGEAVFKYISKNEPKFKKYTYFVIDNKNPDYKRLKKYGKVVKLNSIKHKYLYLNTRAILTSHNAPLFYKAFTKNEKYYRDLLNYEYIWLQHGITYNDVSEGANKLHKLYDKVIIAANMEKKEFEKEKYMLDKEDIVLAGFPRFDYLEDNSENIITIAPTWRRSLTGNVLNDGSHETVEGYEESNYHQTFKAVLTSKKIINLLKKNKFQLHFILHPGMSGYLENFQKLESENVKVIPPQDVIYSEVFSKSKLFITDYSSTFFDFAYLKKPEIFFQFDKEEFYTEHYQKSDFVHEKDAFGDVVTTIEDLENKIEEYFKNNFKMEEKYIKRVEKTFKNTDKNNCKRVVDQLLK